LRGVHLDNKDKASFGKSDPFLNIYSSTKPAAGGVGKKGKKDKAQKSVKTFKTPKDPSQSGYMLIHKTEVVNNNLNPTWREVT
jgi:hypothetical protein